MYKDIIFSYNILLILFSACLALLLTNVSILKAKELTSGALKCNFSNEISQMVSVKIDNSDIAGAVLKFPKEYALSPIKDGQQRDGLLLRVDIRDFSSYPKRKQYLADGTSKVTAGIRDWMQILISSYIDMDKMALRHVSSAYRHLKFEDPSTDLEGELLENGLRNPHHGDDPQLKRNDVFFNKQNGKITDVILCSKVNSVPFPSCGHRFEAGAYDMKITYSRKELARWQEFKTRTEKLLQCFTIKQPIQQPN